MEPSTTTSTQRAYTELVQTLRDLGDVLRPALAAQYEAPPTGFARGSGQISNPTLDIVLDPRRMALSEAVSGAVADLRRATTLVGPHISHLQVALTRWEGGDEGDTAA